MDPFIWTSKGRTTSQILYRLWADTGCSLEDLPEAMDDEEGWRERVREIRAGSATWWWWWWFYQNYFIQIFFLSVFFFELKTSYLRIILSEWFSFYQSLFKIWIWIVGSTFYDNTLYSPCASKILLCEYASLHFFTCPPCPQIPYSWDEFSVKKKEKVAQL